MPCKTSYNNNVIMMLTHTPPTAQEPSSVGMHERGGGVGTQVEPIHVGRFSAWGHVVVVRIGSAASASLLVCGAPGTHILA